MKKKNVDIPLQPVVTREHWAVFITLKDGKEESFPVDNIYVDTLLRDIEQDRDNAVLTFKANFTDFYMVKWGNVSRLYFKNVPEKKNE